MRLLQVPFLKPVIVTLFFLIVVLLFSGGGHLFTNNNRYEIARRADCIHNLKKIAEVLQNRNLQLGATNLVSIQRVINELNLKCSSGKEIQKDPTQAGYKAVVNPSGGVLITEDTQNHNPALMRSIKMPRVSFYLDGQLQKQTIFFTNSEIK